VASPTRSSRTSIADASHALQPISKLPDIRVAPRARTRVNSTRGANRQMKVRRSCVGVLGLFCGGRSVECGCGKSAVDDVVGDVDEATVVAAGVGAQCRERFFHVEV
jgi:hypothetical protein